VPLLRIIIASTRPGRVGLPVGRWFADVARAHGGFDVGVTALPELTLPFMDEPKHPRFREYTHDHTRAWSETVDASDAFVFVMPEYNFGINAPLKNAIDFLHSEWHYKTCGFVSYGGGSGGMRAVEGIKPVVTCLRMMPVFETVAIAGFANMIKDGVFEAPEAASKSGLAMLAELKRATDANEPIIVTLWRPHWAYDAFPIRDLEDPKGSLGETEEIHTFGKKGISEEKPNFSQLVKNFVFTDEQLSELENLMFSQEHYAGKDHEAAVAEWLKANPDFVEKLKAGELGA